MDMDLPQRRSTKISGNDLHAFMDSAAKTLRHKHREVGHDIPALIQMMALFGNKYKPMQIFRTWLLHKTVDGMDSGFKAGVRKSHKGYGKKDSYLEIINKLKAELFRI